MAAPLSRFDRREVVAVFAGGAAGTGLRAALAEALPHATTEWPWATFAVNIVAAFLLGYLVTRLLRHPRPSTYRRPLLGTGFCGGLSTFSTMQLELVRMIDAHAYALAGAYAGTSVVAGYAAVQVAVTLAHHTGIAR